MPPLDRRVARTIASSLKVRFYVSSAPLVLPCRLTFVCVYSVLGQPVAWHGCVRPLHEPYRRRMVPLRVLRKGSMRQLRGGGHARLHPLLYGIQVYGAYCCAFFVVFVSDHSRVRCQVDMHIFRYVGSTVEYDPRLNSLFRRQFAQLDRQDSSPPVVKYPVYRP